jgi:hypothetical protein
MQNETDTLVVSVTEAPAFMLYRVESSNGYVHEDAQSASTESPSERSIVYAFCPARLSPPKGYRPIGLFDCGSREVILFAPQNVDLTVPPINQRKVQAFLDEVVQELAQIDLADAAQYLLDEALFERRYDERPKYKESYVVAAFEVQDGEKTRGTGTWL